VPIRAKKKDESCKKEQKAYPSTKETTRKQKKCKNLCDSEFKA